MKLDGSKPSDSCLTAAATSKSVVSTGKLFVKVPCGDCSLILVSVYADAGLLELLGGFGVSVGTDGGAFPARSAFSRSALILLSSLSAAILSLILCLASTSSCFSLFFAAAT